MEFKGWPFQPFLAHLKMHPMLFSSSWFLKSQSAPKICIYQCKFLSVCRYGWMCVSQCPCIFLYASRIIKCSKIFFWHLVSFSLFPSLALSLSLFIMLFFLNQIPTLMNDNLCECVQKNKVLLNPETGTTTTTITRGAATAMETSNKIYNHFFHPCIFCGY